MINSVYQLYVLFSCLVALSNWMMVGVTGERENSHIRWELEEECPAGTRVGDLVEDAGLRDLHSSDIIQEFRFRFVADSVPFFDISATSGIIRTTSKIDRDSPALCRQKEVCEIHLSVVIQPVRYLHIIKVIVEIKDLNDNPPMFKDNSFNLQIIEAASVGSAYVLPTAADWDSPKFGVRRYELIPSSNKFSLHQTKKLDGSTEVKLALNDRLDRETEPQYRLRLVAFDGGSRAKSGSVEVTVDVLDSNDNKPEFSSPQYQVSVSENIPPGTVILQVQATDRDVGPSGEVEFSFATQTQALHGHLFGIRNTTGNIYVRGTIDHEKSSVYHLVVIARDRGPDSMASEATVIVHVTDVNDNSPVVVANTLGANQASGTTGIVEDCPVGTFIAHVTVHDADAGLNGRVNCTLNTNTFLLIQKYATEYQVVTAVPLDRERVAKYNFLVRCQDGGTVAHLTETPIQVVVTDVNDNAPLFSKPIYKGSIMENNFVGASVLQVTATDLDEGDNARVQYSVPGDMAVRFNVDQNGVISAQDSVDREKYDSFRFPILAFDSGKPTRTGSALIVIIVEDVNDERPQFSHFWYHFNVSENEPIGTKVGTVTAEDRDGPLYNGFVYSFISGHVKVERFSIDPHTGLIQTTRQLDREAQDVYQLSVMVRDQKFGSMSGTAGVTILVTDRNDNSPYFEFPSLTNNTVHISSLVPVGHAITRVVTRDLDAGENRKMSLSLLSSGDNATPNDDNDDDDEDTDGKWFAIDSEQGTVTVTSVLAGIDYRVFQLLVLATDHGQPPRSTPAELLIVVNRTLPFGGRFSRPGENGTAPLFSHDSPLVFMLVAVTLGCLIVASSLFVALVIARRRKERRKRSQKSCRMETLRTLMTKETILSSAEGTPVKLSNGNGLLYAPHHNCSDVNEVTMSTSVNTQLNHVN